MSPFLRQTAEGVIISLHVQPRASRNEIAGVQGEELKIRLTSPPVEGAANRLCIEYFSKLLDVPKSDIHLIAGDKSRHKRILLRNARLPEVEALLSPVLRQPTGI